MEWRRRETGRLISELGSRLLGVVGDVDLVRSRTAWLVNQEGDEEEEGSLKDKEKKPRSSSQ